MHTPFARAPFALLLAAGFAASCLGAALPARAQDLDDSTPPGVARLSAAEGQVTLSHGQASDQAAAVPNAPIVAGDYLTTGDDGRAEIQFGNDTILRAGANAQVRFTQLDPSAQIAQVAQGSIELRVFASGEDNVTIQTPSVDVEPSEAGAYLVTVKQDGNTEVTARSGSIAVVTPQGTQQVGPGRTLVATGQASNPEYQYIDEVATTDLESWGDQRDQAMVAANDAQSQYLPGDMTGSADLSDNGQWVDIPGYGDAWVPNDESPDWSPYSDGSWVTLNYYGPTWVSAEPWGWAPYHYGRWFYAPAVGWAWTPGPRYVRPVWSPALVAFFGFGGGFGLGLGFGSVGWVPLAPGEFGHPWWGPGASLSFDVGYSNYRNYARGFVAEPRSAWERGVEYRAHPLSVAQLSAAHFYGGSLPVQRLEANRPAAMSRSVSAWQHFGGAQARFARASYAPSYARPQYENSMQRQYQGYAQRQYQSYQPRQYQGGYYQRQYQGYQARQYAAPRQYQYAQRQYAPRQYAPRQYARPQSYARSAPSHTRSYGGGGRQHGPGRP